jgi:hypothetical protein
MKTRMGPTTFKCHCDAEQNIYRRQSTLKSLGHVFSWHTDDKLVASSHAFRAQISRINRVIADLEHTNTVARRKRVGSIVDDIRNDHTIVVPDQ